MKREHAVVIGAGVTGLQAGRALSSFFESVTIIEKETIQKELKVQLVSLPRIRIRENCTVTGLIPSVDNKSIQGVLALSSNTDILKLRHADFVIDASGRSSRSLKWLSGLGYGNAEQISVPQTSYFRRQFETLMQWPDRFVVLGDALCSLPNQDGRNVSTLEIAAMELALRSRISLDGLAEALQKEFAEILSRPWMIASGDWRATDAILHPKMWWSILKKATGLSGFAERNL